MCSNYSPLYVEKTSKAIQEFKVELASNYPINHCNLVVAQLHQKILSYKLGTVMLTSFSKIATFASFSFELTKDFKEFVRKAFCYIYRVLYPDVQKLPFEN